MVICPNLKNPDVAREFNELKNATSEAAAYHIWSLNNGNGIDKAPNGAESKLFLTLLEYYNGDRTKAIQAKAKTYGMSFLNWFGDWINAAKTNPEVEKQLSLVFERIPELNKIGSIKEYAAYLADKFPNSVDRSIYWHGTNEDLSEGFKTAKRGKGSGALETQSRNDFYLAKQAWTVLQYVNGVNRNSVDKNGFAHWNKLWWELKEIMSNGRRENNNWKDIVIGEETVRQRIPNKKGVFNRDKGGENGKWLSERKADYGYENKSDREFFEDILGIQWGKDTFNTWTKRNAEVFKALEKTQKGIYPAIINTQNPIREKGQNTYYEEQRGLFTQAEREGNDAILGEQTDNEFGSDVAVVLNASENNVHFLGTKEDIEGFKKWLNENRVSKVVDENGEPLVVWHSNDSENFDSNRVYNWFSTKRQNYYGSNQYAVFLNIKKLFKKDNPTMDERAMVTDYGSGSKYDKLSKEYDGGMVYHKTFGYYEIVTTRSSNQAKSIDNQGNTPYEGTFSTENNDIYLLESSKDVSAVNKTYTLNYNTELKLQKTEDFNPFNYFRDRNYSVLCEKSSIQFEKYRSVAKRYRKNDKVYGYPAQFLDKVTGILYIKSNKYKNSRKYDAVNSKTGEFIKYGITLFTFDEFEKHTYKISEKERTSPKTYSPARAINFALLRQLPSKNRYKALAKQFIYDVIDPKEGMINFKIIDTFVDSMPDALWDYISSDVYGFNEDVYIGPFFAGRTDTSNITAATSKINSDDLSVNLPKLGLIKTVEQITGVKLLGRKVKFNDRNAKLPNKSREWGEEVVLDNNLTRPEIEYLIRKILHEEYFRSSTTEENIKHFAEDHGLSIELVKAEIELNEEFDDIYGARENQLAKNYDWQWESLKKLIETTWNKTVSDYIINRYKDKFTKNDISFINLYFSGVLPWIKIEFNVDSGKDAYNHDINRPEELFIRLASVIHEPFHALHALSYGSKEELELRDSYRELINTEFGKKLYNVVKSTLSKNTDNEGIYKETCAYMFQIINTPSELLDMMGDEFLSSKIYNLIRDIIELPIETEIQKVQKTTTASEIKQTESTKIHEHEVKLNFIQKLYNFLVHALHKIIPLTKQYINLINNIVEIEEDVVELKEVDIQQSEETEISVETERSKLLQLAKGDFLNKLDKFESSIKTLQSIDNATLSSVNINEFFKKSDNFNQESDSNSFDDVNYNLSTPSRAYAIRESLVNRGILHKFKGYRITKSNPYGEYAEDIIESECEKARIVPVFTRGKNSVEVDFLENTTIETGPKDEIERSNDTSQEAIKKVLAVLQKKVPWLKVKFISPSTIPSGVNKSANSFIKGDTVYLVKGRATTESTIEEFLHPIIYSIQVINNSLFLDLLYEAKHDFPKLWKEICRTYRNDIGFNENDRYNELVTQALSRYVHNDYRNANNKITVRDLVYKVFNFVARILNNAIQYVGGKAIITPENLTKLNLRQLSLLFMAEDSTFMIWTSSKILYNINSQQERAKKVSEDITNLFDILYKAYERMPNKSPRRQRILNEIFEKFNELKRTLDYHAVSIAVNFALETLGQWNPSTNTPERNDSVSGYLYKQSLLPEPFSGITPDILVEMYTNSIAFYENLLNKYIPNNIDSMMTKDDRDQRDAVENLLKQYIKPMWIKAMCVVGDRIVDQNIDNEVTASDLDKENMKIVAKDWLHKNIMYGDIKGYAAYIFNNSYSKNPIIKLVFHMIQHAETKTLEEMRPISTRITRAFLLANAGKRRIGPNWQTVLMEFNKDGIPTGNFVRDVNYGQYEEDLTEFVKELNEEFIDKYNYTYVDDGTGVIINSLTGDLAENEEWGPNGEEPKYVEYLKRIEQWKCEHCNRRYTLDYYMERMSAPYRGSLDPNEVNLREFGHGLSPRTLSKYNYILTNINYYLNLCTDPNTGFSHPEKLSLVDKLKLDLWQEELEKIQNPYDKNGEPKSYEDRQIAFEIRAWQKWLGEHLTTTIDYEAFQEEYDKIRQEALDTNNPRLISDFFRYNSDVGINPDFIELTIGQFSKTYQSDPAVIHANLLKGSILRLVKSKNGYTRNFQEVENNPSFWLDCKRIDLTIEDLREKSSRDFAKELDEKFKFEKILYRDVNGFAQDSNGNQVLPQDEKNHKDLLTYLQYLINEYTKKILASSSRTLPGLNDRQGNPIVFNGTADDVKKTMGYLFSYTREYTDWEGNLIRQQVPLSILTMMLPKVETFHNTRTNRKERTIINIPKGRFAEKQDEGGRFINKDYDQSKHISEQPKREYYDNADAWEKVESDSNLKRLYDVLIDEMKNAQKNYQAPGYNFNYRLPQVNANVMLIWSRIYKRGLGNTLQALYEAATTVEENDEAMRTTEDYITSPDGSVATDVPLKYVRKLKNPENITTDVVGSVILFANMAINYKNKCEIDADIKALRYNIDYNNRIDLYKVDKEAGGNDFVPQNDKNSIKMFDSMTNKHVYGNQWSIDPNQLQENKQPVKNAWRGVASSAIGFGSSTAALGALIGLPFGAPGSGAILGGLVGGVLGGLQGAAANGLFEGIALFKGIKNMQRIETTQTLALNMFSMLVGFGDSMTRIFKESLGGKYLTVRDAIVSFGSVLRYTPQCIANIGNPLANNKLTRAMQLNGISKGIRQIFEHMNYGKVRRVASNLLMGGFSMLDWMANALLLRAFYNNVRFYDGNVVPKGFYTSYELTQAFAKAGVKHPKKQAWLSHFVSGTTLWDAYDEYMNVRPEFAGYTGTIEDYKKLFHFVGTEDELKDEYEQYKKDHPVYVTQRLKTLIRTKTMKRGALYNGMNPDNDIPLWKQDIIGGIIGSLRAWLAQSTQHLIAGGIDNIVKEYKTDVEFKNVGTKTKSEETVKVLPMNNEQRSMAFAWDYETGMPLDQIITGIIRSFKTLSNKIRQLSFLGINAKSTQKDQTKAKFSYVEKYAWKDALIYLGVLAAMMFAWTFVHDWSGNVPPPKDRQHASPKSLYPQDIYDYFKDVYLPNEYYKLLVDNLVFRTIEAQLTNIDPTSTLDVLTSVSALQNGVEEHFGIIKPVWDIAGLSGHKIDEVINRGSYKFYTRGERALYKFVGPLDNLHTFFSYYGMTENEKFYTNTYGHIYRAFGYEFKKNNKSKPKQQNQEDDYGFGGGFDSGFDGGFDSGF